MIGEEWINGPQPLFRIDIRLVSYSADSVRGLKARKMWSANLWFTLADGMQGHLTIDECKTLAEGMYRMNSAAKNMGITTSLELEDERT